MKKRIAGALALLAVAFGAAACDGDGSTEPTARPEGPSATCTPVLGGGGGKAGTDTVWVCQQGAPAGSTP